MGHLGLHEVTFNNKSNFAHVYLLLSPLYYYIGTYMHTFIYFQPMQFGSVGFAKTLLVFVGNVTYCICK